MQHARLVAALLVAGAVVGMVVVGVASAAEAAGTHGLAEANRGWVDHPPVLALASLDG